MTARSVALLCLFALPRTAAADDEAVRQAQIHLDTGADHFRAGRYEQAVVEFREALAVVEEPDLVWNIARAYEEMGDATNAVFYFRQYAETWPEDPSAADAKTRIERLAPKLPGWLLPDCGGFKAVRVSVDGADPVACGKRIGPLEPGVHVIQANAPGKQPWTTEATVAPGSEVPIRIRLEQALAPEPKPASEPAPVEPAPEPSPLLPWAFSAGAGVLGWAAALTAAFAWDSSVRADQARTAYAGAPAGSELERNERDRYTEASDEMLLWSGIAIASAVGALACASAATWLFLPTDTVGLALTPGPSGPALTFHAAW